MGRHVISVVMLALLASCVAGELIEKDQCKSFQFNIKHPKVNCPICKTEIPPPPPVVVPQAASLEDRLKLVENANGIKLVKLGDKEVYYYFSKTQKSWQGALENCKKMGLDLVAIETKEENDLIVEEIKKLSSDPDFFKPYQGLVNSFWTSGNDIAREGAWNWATTGGPVAMERELWHGDGECCPPDGDDAQNCQLIFAWSEETKDIIKWGSGVCCVRLSFICELQ